MSDIRDWLESLRNIGMRRSLEAPALLLARLGMPQSDFPSTHVAGSNGKGSCCVMVANSHSVFGQCVGLFTSPHLCFVEERIRIHGVPISAEMFDACLGKVRKAAEQEPVMLPSYYEATFLVAMLAFSEACVDRAVIETGLGGRLDATKLVDADICVLTEITLEHTEILGDTLGEIAREKAAIARLKRPLIARWSYDKEVREAIEVAVMDSLSGGYWVRHDRDMIIQFEVANQKSRPIPLTFFDKSKKFDGWTTFGKEAANMAEGALLPLVGPKKAGELVSQAVKQTCWPGRMQWHTHEGVDFLFDAAHNPSGMAKACQQILIEMEGDQSPAPSAVIVGCTKQKDLAGFLHPLVELLVTAEVSNIIVTQPQGGRTPAMPAEELAKELSIQGAPCETQVASKPSDALALAQNLVADGLESPILVIGSLYLVGNMFSLIGLDTREAMTTFTLPSQGGEWK